MSRTDLLNTWSSNNFTGHQFKEVYQNVLSSLYQTWTFWITRCFYFLCLSWQMVSQTISEDMNVQDGATDHTQW